ncbi:MAG TPA: putative glycolipid-binding domain-containing protein [Cryptosporangiaceae bacterium]|nr:putative glycolipid-binding domain-containing protein [Cryptosporangiaceae bacterium]
MSRSLTWQRVDAFGAEACVADDGDGLRAHGWALGANPALYHCTYTLHTDSRWRSTSLEVRTEGAGWSRSLKLRRDADGWQVRTSETGNLDASLPGTEAPERLADCVDVDLGLSPLTNTLPVRRLNMLNAAPDTSYDLTMAWIHVPTLAVMPDAQRYTALGDGRVAYGSDRYQVELELDDAGYLVHYPGLARRLA